MKVRIARGRREGFTSSGAPKLGRLEKPVIEVSWEKLARRLTQHVETEDKGSVAFMIGGYYRGDRRIEDNLVARTLLTLDFDHVDSDDIELALAGLEFTYAAHTTHSHAEDDGRWRVVVPLSRPVSDKRVFEILTRYVGDLIDIDSMDPASTRMGQLMFMPACKPGCPRNAIINTELGELDVDTTLALFDIEDPFSWPHARNDTPDDRPQVHRLEDPREKDGLIGAWCRIYTISQAIEEFALPYEMTEDDRLMYTLGEGNPGVKLYDDDTHLFSHHTDDPAGGKNHNAWDLVRVHKFGELDVGVPSDTPIHLKPSQQRMTEFAMGFADVVREKEEWDASVFEDLGPDEAAPAAPREPGEAPVEPEARLPGYDDLLQRIEGRREPLDMDARRGILNGIAACREIDPMQEDDLLARMRDASSDPKPTKKALHDSLKHANRLARTGADEISDIEMDLIERVLERRYQNGRGLIRVDGAWWAYDRGVWREINTELVLGVVDEEISILKKERPKDARDLVAAVSETNTSAQAGALRALFTHYVARKTADEAPDGDPLKLRASPERPVINCANTEVHFDEDGTWRTVPHDPDHRLIHQIPVEFDPKADTSDWDAFAQLLFHDALEPDEMARHLEEAAGYCLTPWRELATVFLMRGEPAAGKSTFAAVLNRLMGDAIADIDFKDFAAGRNAHAEWALVGKLVALDDDFPERALLPAGFLKKVSEEKQVMINPKNAKQYSAVLRSVPMILTNDWPAIHDRRGGIERRAQVWDLTSIPLADRSMTARRALLSAGLAGALLRFADGLARLYGREGADENKFDTPAECAIAYDAWHINVDVVARWAGEHITPCEHGDLRSTDAWSVFRHWYMDEYAVRSHMPGRTSFYDRLSVLLKEPPTRDKNGMHWAGWKLTVAAEEF